MSNSHYNLSLLVQISMAQTHKAYQCVPVWRIVLSF